MIGKVKILLLITLFACGNSLVHVAYSSIDYEVKCTCLQHADGISTFKNDPSGCILAKTHYPDGSSTTNTYDSLDQLIAARDAEGHWVTNRYDSRGRIVSVKSTQSSISNQYDVVGNITNTIVDPAGLHIKTSSTYDLLNRKRTASTPNATEHYQYDKLGRQTNRLDAAGESWKTHYDAQNRPVTQTRPSGHTEATEYDKLGNRTAFINAETNAIRYGVDAQGRITAITNAIGNTTRFGYDDSGNVAWRQNADSNLVNYTYDTLNRLTSVSYKGDWQKNFTYDANGNCLTASGLIGTNIYAYDVMNRLTSSTIRVHSHSFAVQNQYDANGNRTNLIYPGGLSVGYAYDAENRLTGVTANHAHNAKHFTFAYDGASRLTGLSYPNGVHSTFGYNAEGQVTNFTYDGFIRRQNTRNALGFKTTETINAGLAPQSPPARQLQKTHNAANQLTGEQIVTGSVTSQLVYAYDDNGCLEGVTSTSISDLTSKHYSYDYENRLSSVQSATSAVHYQYDTEGARIARTCNGVTTYFIPDPVDGLKRPLAEADAQENITRYYVWSGARLLCHIEADDGTPRYYHSDELGSTLALTDDYGVTDRFAYMPYGTATHSGSTQTPFLWLGGYGVFYDDAADLHLTVHRAYSPRLKRFIQPDPLGIDGGPNVYMWANMNPLFFVDPFGLCAEGGGDWNMMTRLGGAAQMVGGGVESAAGYTFGTVTSPTLVGGLAGAAIGTHGLDNLQAGFRQMVSGQPVDTMTSQAMQSVGVSRNTANLTDAGMSIVFTAGASYLNSVSQASAVVNMSDDSLALVDRFHSPQAASSKAQYWKYNRAGRTGAEITEELTKQLDNMLLPGNPGEVFIPSDALPSAKYTRALEKVLDWY